MIADLDRTSNSNACPALARRAAARIAAAADCGVALTTEPGMSLDMRVSTLPTMTEDTSVWRSRSRVRMPTVMDSAAALVQD